MSKQKSKTLMDVLNAINSSPRITDRRRQQLEESVRWLSAKLGKDPRKVAADAQSLINCGIDLTEVHSYQNCGRPLTYSALLRAAFRHLRQRSRASRASLSRPWLTLIEKVEESRLHVTGALPLILFLSNQGVAPQGVEASHLRSFREEFQQLDRPEDAGRPLSYVTHVWNALVKNCPVWPQVMFPRKRHSKTYSQPWTTFPASLRTDVQQLMDHLRISGLGNRWSRKTWNDATLRGFSYELQSYASAVIETGIKASTLTSLARLLSIENYKRGLEWIYKRRGGKPCSSMRNLASRLLHITKWWVKADRKTLVQMERIVAKLTPRFDYLSPKSRERLRKIVPEREQHKLYNLPARIREYVENADHRSSGKICYSCAATAIEILLYAPLRLGNLASLHLDRNFLTLDGNCYIRAPRRDLRGASDLMFRLPQESMEHLDWYVSRWRFADASNRFLFPGKGSSSRASYALAQSIRNTIRMFTGNSVNPHLFRHLAATNYLSVNPGGYEVVQAALGHQSLRTTYRFYASLEERMHRAEFANTIQRLGMGQGNPREL